MIKEEKEILKTTPTLHLKWKRSYVFHYNILLEAAKNLKTLKAYTLYINLHSLYRQKVILNYKKKKIELAAKCGLSVPTYLQYLSYLKENKLVVDCCGHLQIRKINNWIPFLKLDDYYNFDNIFILRQRYFENSSVSYKQLQVLALEIKRKQKRYKALNELEVDKDEKNLISSGKLTRKTSNVWETKLRQKVSSSLASEKLNIHLYLQDIKNYFNLNSNQSASSLISSLEKEGLIEIINRFRYYKKIGKNFRGIPKGYINLNGWMVKQLPSKIVFKKPILTKNKWEIILEEEEVKLEKIKKEFLKAKKVSKGLINFNLSEFNYKIKKNPLVTSLKKVEEVFIDRSTGEVVHTAHLLEKSTLSRNCKHSVQKLYLTSYNNKFKNRISYLKERTIEFIKDYNSIVYEEKYKDKLVEFLFNSKQ